MLKFTMSSLSNFKNKEPISKKKNIFIGLVFCAFFVFTLLFYHSHQNSQTLDLPEIFITCDDEIELRDYTRCKIEIFYKNNWKERLSINSKIKLQGRSNSDLPKLSYRLEFKVKVPLFGMRKDDDWQLFAMYQDITRMRYKLSFDLWRSLFPTNPTTILPESRFVKVFLNAEYQGLYLLAEKNDRKLFGLDNEENGLDSSLIFQSQCLEGHSSLGEYHDDCWDQDWPDKIDIKEDILLDLIEFVTEVSDEEFFNPKEGVYTIFDKDNLIDFFLFNFFILHVDFWIRNYYILRDTAPNKFYLIPWDFDRSFGQFGKDQSYFWDADYNNEEYLRSLNYLFDRLVGNDDFMHDCKNRWRELRKELWTEDFILDMLEDMYKEIKDELEKDLNKWEPEVSLQKYVDHLFEWIPERLDYCDDYFNDY